MSPSWTRTKERGGSTGIRILLIILNLFGHAPARLVMRFVVFYFYITRAKERRASIDYLGRIYRLKPEALKHAPGFFDGLRHYMSFANCSLERFWLWQGKLSKFSFSEEGTDEVKALLKQGRGCLLIGAHVGSFDALRVFAEEYRVPVNAVMYLENARKYNDMLARMNPDARVNIIHLQERSVGEILALKDRIDRGEIVAILADRFFPGAKNRVGHATFLDQQAAFPANPWIIASLLECPVAMFAGLQTGNRVYHSIIRFIGPKIEIERAHRQQAIDQYVSGYAQFLESILLRHPYQWFNFFDFWSTDDSVQD